MSKSQITMPEVETKTLLKYRVTKSFVVSFSAEVYAEDVFDAETIAEELMQSVEYTESMGCEIDQSDLDKDGDYQNISDLTLEYVEEHSDGLSCETMGEEIQLFKMDEWDWEDNYNVSTDEDDCIEQWKEDNDIEDED